MFKPAVISTECGLSSDLTVDPVDPYLARCLSAHLEAEFPDCCWPSDWATWTGANAKLIGILRMVSRRRTFVGACEICEAWYSYAPPVTVIINTEGAVSQYLESKRQDIVQASLDAYANILGTFSRKFPCLPTKPEPIEEYLASKPSFRSRRLIYGILNGLYDFAERRLGAPQVMKLIARPPKGKRKESDYTNLEQLRDLVGAVQNDRQKALFLSLCRPRF